nr:MAG TPA_asm: hypothetical protein [Caudoviricetes sp.]
MCTSKMSHTIQSIRCRKLALTIRLTEYLNY